MWSLQMANTMTGRACSSTLMPVWPAPATVSHPPRAVVLAVIRSIAVTPTRSLTRCVVVPPLTSRRLAHQKPRPAFSHRTATSDSSTGSDRLRHLHHERAFALSTSCAGSCCSGEAPGWPVSSQGRAGNAGAQQDLPVPGVGHAAAAVAEACGAEGRAARLDHGDPAGVRHAAHALAGAADEQPGGQRVARLVHPLLEVLQAGADLVTGLGGAAEPTAAALVERPLAA